MRRNFYFIRHGESEENKFRILGDGTSPLSMRGKKEAAMTAERLRTLPIDKIVASTYTRARQTAEAISAVIGLPVEHSESLVERWSPSSVHGRSMEEEEVKEVFKAIHQAYLDDPNYNYEDAESFNDLKKRAQVALDFLLKTEGEHVVVVSHGLFMRVVIGEMLFGDNFTGSELSNLIHGLMTKNTGLTWCQYDEEFHLKPWRIVTWNDHNHLAEIEEK